MPNSHWSTLESRDYDSCALCLADGGGWKAEDANLADARGALAGARVRLVNGPLVDFIDEILAGLGRLAEMHG